MSAWNRSLPLVLSLLLLAAVARAGELETALDKMRRGDYAEAYCLLRPLAEAGNDRAQYALGWMYHNGYGLRIDEARAIDWWQRAAARDNADALFALAQLHELGMGTRRDPQRAAELYVEALALGSDEARNLIIGLLQRGDEKMRQALVEALRDHWSLLGEVRRVRSQAANVREGPSTRRKVRFRLRRDDPLLVVDHKGRWLRILDMQRGRGGWVHDSLVEPPAEEPAEEQRGELADDHGD